ncbi:MAG: ribonuclease III [Calditrichaeota bacterium]|nr:MAG: ribonuclease III [Calditrichota bacterium]
MGFWQKLFKSEFSEFTAEDRQKLDAIQKITGYHFHDLNLLLLALTHRSFHKPGEKKHTYRSNERLEFLGDSVLGLVIAEMLYLDHPDLREGRMTKMKAMLVNEITLSNVGKTIKLNEQIRMSPEEENLGGRQRPSIISDAFEAILGAVYIDGGLGAASDVITRLIYARKDDILSDKSQKNFKGDLLELMQANGDGMPYYEVESEIGPDHDKEFEISVYINKEKIGHGRGHTKKEAEQKAAAMALKSLKEE